MTDETRDTETATEEADFDGKTQADDAAAEAAKDDVAAADEADDDVAQADETDETDEESADAETTEDDTAAAEESSDEDVTQAEAAEDDSEGVAESDADVADVAHVADVAEATEIAQADEEVAAADEIDETDETDETDEDVAEAEAPDKRRRNLWGWTQKLNWGWTQRLKTVPVILVLLLVITGGAATWLFYNEYRPDRQTDPQTARAVVSAASKGTVALLSYSPDTLDQDFASAKSHLGGDFLSYYDNFTQTIIGPAAKQKSLKTTARVISAAVSELRGNSAVVLLFVNQTTTSRENPKPAVAASSVLVNMTRIDGKWLITKFSPF